MSSRDDWAARSLAARIEACRCVREGMLADNVQRMRQDCAPAWPGEVFNALETDFALDLLDLPAPVDLTPYLTAAAIAEYTVVVEDGVTRIVSNEEWAKQVVGRARALRAAALEGGKHDPR